MYSWYAKNLRTKANELAIRTWLTHRITKSNNQGLLLFLVLCSHYTAMATASPLFGRAFSINSLGASIDIRIDNIVPTYDTYTRELGASLAPRACKHFLRNIDYWTSDMTGCNYVIIIPFTQPSRQNLMSTCGPLADVMLQFYTFLWTRTM